MRTLSSGAHGGVTLAGDSLCHEDGWKTVVSALAVLLTAGVFVQLGLGAQSPEPSIAAEATVGSDNEGSRAPVSEPTTQPDRQRDDRDRGRDEGNRDEGNRDDRRDKSKDRDDDNGSAPTGGAPAGDTEGVWGCVRPARTR